MSAGRGGWPWQRQNRLNWRYFIPALTLKKGEDVEVLRMAPDEACATDMLVLVRWQSRKLAVPLAQLTTIDPDESTAEAIGYWHYWVAQGYLF